MQSDKIKEELTKLKRELDLRGFSKKTIQVYNYNLEKFLKTDFEHSKTGVEDYLLKLKNEGFQIATIRLTIATLRFYFSKIHKKDFLINISLPKRKKQL